MARDGESEGVLQGLVRVLQLEDTERTRRSASCARHAISTSALDFGGR